MRARHYVFSLPRAGFIEEVSNSVVSLEHRIADGTRLQAGDSSITAFVGGKMFLYRNRLTQPLQSVALGLAVIGLLASNFAGAQEVEFDIDAQRTDLTLLDIAEASDVQILFVPDIAVQSDSPEVRGIHSVRSALERSLHTTELVYEFKSQNFVVVKQERSQVQRPTLANRASQTRPVMLAALQSSELENAQTSESSQDADDQVDSPVDDPRESIEEVVVTGTRLRNSSPTSPVEVFTRLDIERLGIYSVEEFVRSLPQNHAGQTQTSAIDGSSSVGTLGVATGNLRGLGSDGTLVLINGRRTATTPTIQGSNINLNSIPFSAIERIEVLTDGAASIYGGDAVAGVMNFILKKEYDADEELSFRYTSGGNGGDSMVLEPTFGVNWGSGSLSGSLRFETIDPVLAADTGFTTQDFTARGGSDKRLPPSPFHPLVIRDALTFQPLGGVNPSRDAAMPVTLADISMANLPPWDSVPTHLTDERESTTAFVTVTQNLSDLIESYFEFNYADYESYAERGGILTERAIVPPSNAFNDTGIPLFVNSYKFQLETQNGLITPSSNQSQTESYGAVAGILAELPVNNWQLDSFVKFAQEEAWIRAFDGPNSTELAARLADSNPETALNLFGDGSQQTAAAVANLFAVSDHPWSLPTSNTNETVQFSLSANGDLFSIPGGNVAGVLGYDYRKDSRTFSGYIATTLLDTEPERAVNAVYSEVMIPIIGDGNSMPGVHSLEFRAAARWEEYIIKGPFDGAGSDTQREFAETSPSIGFAWYITPEFKLRANFGDTFKAPRLDQLFGASELRVSFFSTIIRSILAGAGIFTDPETGAPIGVYATNSGGNPDLKPEISDTLTVGFDYLPTRALNGLQIRATYTEIETQDVVASASSVLSGAPDRFIGVTAARDESGNIYQWNMIPINFSQETVRAADLNLSYDFDRNWGHVQVGASGTYTFERSLTFFAGGTPVESQETFAGPDRLKYRAWFACNNGPWAATLNMNYSSSYEYAFSPVQNRVDSYMTFDFTGSYEFGDGWRLDLGIRNVTDEEFPFIDQRQPFDPRRVDIMGRTSYLEVSKSLDLL